MDGMSTTLGKLPGLPRPHYCYCQLPMERLLAWVRCKQAGATTVELMRAAHDEQDREMIAVVALLDVDEATLAEAMSDISLPEHSALHCREELKRRLATGQSPRRRGVARLWNPTAACSAFWRHLQGG